jgi:hypothetical protein
MIACSASMTFACLASASFGFLVASILWIARDHVQGRQCGLDVVETTTRGRWSFVMPRQSGIFEVDEGSRHQRDASSERENPQVC